MFQAKVQDYYKQMNDLVTETYSEEDQQIIGCPSIQQVGGHALVKASNFANKFSNSWVVKRKRGYHVSRAISRNIAIYEEESDRHDSCYL